MIVCRNGAEHTHESVTQSKICWGVLGGEPSGTVIRPVTPVMDATTPKQIAYVSTLGGDADYAAGLGKVACSDYIKSLLRKGKPVTEPAAPAVPWKQPRTKRQDFIIGLLPGIPDGYFAVSKDGTDTNVTFLRIKRPTAGQYKGCVKIQTQHSEVLDNKMIYNMDRDNLWLKRGHGDEIEEIVMFLFADWQGSAMRYARLIEKCCRCNLALTDKRSRHYGIGPDCEQVAPWIINLVDERNDGVPFERLPHGA